MSEAETRNDEAVEDRIVLRRVLETSLHLAVVALLLVYCYRVVQPFIQPFAWAAILAVAINPVYLRLRHALGGRAGPAAAALVVTSLLVLAIPTILITANLVESSAEMAGRIQDGTVRVPPPPSSVADWPLVGERVHAFWATASVNLEAAVHEAGPAVKAVAHWLLKTSAGAGKGIVIFMLSLVIAGFLLSYQESVAGVANTVARRLFHERGEGLVELSRNTVESVTRGILGVALIQATLSGIGLLAAGVPAAGLWALLVLLMAVVQLPPILILGPIIVYVFASSPTLVAILFALWTVPVSFSDNLLKPLLLGRGASVPTLVIFVGAIGGFMLEGVIGLFLGAIAVALVFTLLKVWLEDAI
jgi:predicted PurR-regulated permease PerM